MGPEIKVVYREALLLLNETSETGPNKAAWSFSFVMVCCFNGANRALPKENVIFGSKSESVV